MDFNHSVATKYEPTEHINDLKLLLMVFNWNINFMKRSQNLTSCAITFKILTITHNNNINIENEKETAFNIHNKCKIPKLHMQYK